MPTPWRQHDRSAPPPGPVAASFDARWDDELRIYTLADRPCHYLRLGTVYRRLDGQWSAAPSLDGPWRVIATSALPPGFRWQMAEARCGPPTPRAVLPDTTPEAP